MGISSYAQDANALRKKHFNLDGDIGIKGYDPVAYFTEHKAIKGNKGLSVFYKGVIYNFSTVANKELFKAGPSKYEPEYGGWCAYAMGKNGEKISVLPNPSATATNLVIETPYAIQQMTISIHDAGGRLMHTIKSSKPIGKKIIELRYLRLTMGKYYITVYNGKKMISTAEWIKL